jgi:P pilus assembly chaperone PapD
MMPTRVVRFRCLSSCAGISLAFAILVAAPLPLHAQFGVDKTELFLNTSDSVGRSGIVMVRNEGNLRAQATLKLEDWDRAEDGANRFFAPGTVAQSCAQALKIFPLSISLAPGESQAVRVEMDSAYARTLKGRECWSVVLVETAVPQTEAGGRVLLYRLRTGVKVYATPQGLSVDGAVTDVAIRAANASSAGELKDTVAVAFQNTGSKHVIARGRVEVRRADNTTVSVVELPAAYALPGATMRVRAALPVLAPGRYVVLAVMDYGGVEIAAAQLEYEAR